MSLTLKKRFKSFGGWVEYYSHYSTSTRSMMNFSVYRPPQCFVASQEARGKEKATKVPVIYWLSGLTCTEETFMQKAGAQSYLAQAGIMLIAMDTSPRNCGLAGEEESWSFGSGAGFYVDATLAPWQKHYQMFTYASEELPALAVRDLGADPQRQSIMGHSMGGHGALIMALRHPERYCSVSALAPICAAASSAWGQYAYERYLGASQREQWLAYDASALVAKAAHALPLLVDQGEEDEFLMAGQLNPELLVAACHNAGYPLILNRHPGYDHSYYFVASFIGKHIAFHGEHLGCALGRSQTDDQLPEVSRDGHDGEAVSSAN